MNYAHAVLAVFLVMHISFVARAADLPVEMLTPGQMQQDLDSLRRALEETHGGLYRYSTKAELDRRFEGDRAKLNGAMTMRR